MERPPTGNPYRHPQGRSCPPKLWLALLLMPYALCRYAVDERRARKARRR